ncbi:hypothetical protein BJY52DRAFT_1269048 [Lactarius psammicola]|nr:hypothetical protein BJY52DRAFT_1269048 [Lactarius psammicola]
MLSTLAHIRQHLSALSALVCTLCVRYIPALRVHGSPVGSRPFLCISCIFGHPLVSRFSLDTLLAIYLQLLHK